MSAISITAWALSRSSELLHKAAERDLELRDVHTYKTLSCRLCSLRSGLGSRGVEVAGEGGGTFPVTPFFKE